MTGAERKGPGLPPPPRPRDLDRCGSALRRSADGSRGHRITGRCSRGNHRSRAGGGSRRSSATRRLLRACADAADRRSQPRRSDPRAAAERGAGRGGGRWAAQPRHAPGHRRAPDPDPVRAHRRRDHGTGDRGFGAAPALDAGPGRRCHPGRHLLRAGRLEVLRRIPRRAGQRLADVRGGDLPMALAGCRVCRRRRRHPPVAQPVRRPGDAGEPLQPDRPGGGRREHAWVVDAGRAAGGRGCDDLQPGDRRRTATPRVAPRDAGRGVRDPRLRGSRLRTVLRRDRPRGGSNCVRPDRRPVGGRDTRFSAQRRWSR